MNEQANIPKLRFPGFEGEWIEKRIGDHTLSSSFGPRFSSDLYSDVGNVVTLRTTDMDADGKIFYEHSPRALIDPSHIKEHILLEGDLVVSRSGTIGITGIFDEYKLPVIPGAFLIRFRLERQEIIPRYVQLLFNSEKGRNKIESLAAGGVQKNLTGTSILNLYIQTPTLPEQQKIASFLSKVDEKLSQLKKKKELLEQYKKGMMQKIFSQELRFKDDNGEEFPDWEEKRLGEISTKINNKNKNGRVVAVLTNSAVLGIVNQRDFFDKDIANQNNLMGYYIVDTNDFVYNPRISNIAPVGPVGRNHLAQGVMSPLYTVFRFHEGNLDFYERYFQSDFWHEYMESIANYGARHDRMNITTRDFFEMPVPYPSLEEQTKIAKFLSAIDRKIDHTQTQIDKTEQWKKGLLQQMFV